MTRLNVGLVFGGRSAEHEVSILSARSVYAALDKERHSVVPLAIAPSGAWLSPAASAEILDGNGRPVEPLDPGFLGSGKIDVVFNLVHGAYGEDGCLQGFFEIAGLPYVGAGVAGSAVGMDKVLMKAAFLAAGIPVGDYRVLRREVLGDEAAGLADSLGRDLSLPWFVKPANTGSSIGISKVKRPEDLTAALELAFRFDEKVLVETGIDGRELECAVLGNRAPRASVPGEVIPGHEFYDYEDKYFDDKSRTVIPAGLPAGVIRRIQEMAVAAHLAVSAAGMARVDFFWDPRTDRLVVNEINTLPGFTKISMYPKLWMASGLGYAELLDELIRLAFERHREGQRRDAAVLEFLERSPKA